MRPTKYRAVHTETDIKAEIQNALDKLGIPRWRMQAGGYRGRTRGLPKGTHDVLASPNIDSVPVFLWIEVKKPGESPTKEQAEFAVKMMGRGHRCLIARSLDDLLTWLKENKAV